MGAHRTKRITKEKVTPLFRPMPRLPGSPRFASMLEGLCGVVLVCALVGAFPCAFPCAFGCAGASVARADAPRPPHVIMVSLDGTRPIDVTDANLPSVAAFRSQGATAEFMQTVNPSNTFPSHVSLVTGVAPQRHGLVNNVFVDPERGRFAKQDIPSWIEVEPIWSWLADRGVVSASYHWVGSEGPWPPSGRGPLHWKKFSSKTREQVKVEQMLEWFDLEDESQRPRLITSWFHGADHAGHRDGPGTDAVRKSLRSQEKAIATLIAGLEARGAFEYTTLIFVSDHGMVGAEKTVNLGGLLKQAGVRARAHGIGGFATITLPKELGEDERAEQLSLAEAALTQAGLAAYTPQAAPADWRVRHARFGDLVVRAPVGTAIVYWGLSLDGYHGYDPTDPTMRAIFMARGRGARPGTDLGRVQSLDVAPTILHLLGESPPDWMEGQVIEGLRVDSVPPGSGSGRLDLPVSESAGPSPTPANGLARTGREESP